jgi:DNA-binding NarL/FixJ family response regulator
MMPPLLAADVPRPGDLGRTQGSDAPLTHGWRFSPRERQIVSLLASGCSNQEIANRLGLRLQTVKNHLSRVYRKIGVPNRVQLAVRVLQQDPPEGSS